MSPFIYALNIGTFATWLTVAGASSVACVVQISNRLPELISMGELMDADVTAEVDLGDMSQGSAPPSDPTDEVTDQENAPEEQVAEAELPEVPEEVLPEIPEVAEMEPLPEIPDFPQPSPEKPAVKKPESAPKPKVVARNTGKARESTPGARRASSNGRSGSGTGTGDGNATGSGSSPMGSARFAGGRFPKPNYPSEARRNNIQGRVVVFFSVDERGNVVSASVRSSSGNASLDEAAVSSVRRAKFAAGGRATATKPILFRLNS